MTKIYVDADACPVKLEVIKVAERHNLQVLIVSNGGLKPIQHPLVEYIYVSEGLDVVDNWIEERVSIGDFVITADIPLAARCIKKNAIVLGHKGEVYTKTNMYIQFLQMLMVYQLMFLIVTLLFLSQNQLKKFTLVFQFQQMVEVMMVITHLLLVISMVLLAKV